MGRFEQNEVDVISGGFEKYQVFAPVIVEISARHVVQPAIANGRFITVEFSQVPDLAGKLFPGHGIVADKPKGVGFFRSQGQRHETAKVGDRKLGVADGLPNAIGVSLGDGK